MSRSVICCSRNENEGQQHRRKNEHFEEEPSGKDVLRLNAPVAEETKHENARRRATQPTWLTARRMM
jgi:hypothetical protein